MFITLNDKPFSKLTNDQNGTFNATHDFTLRYFAHIKIPQDFCLYLWQFAFNKRLI